VKGHKKKQQMENLGLKRMRVKGNVVEPKHPDPWDVKTGQKKKRCQGKRDKNEKKNSQPN